MKKKSWIYDLTHWKKMDVQETGGVAGSIGVGAIIGSGAGPLGTITGGATGGLIGTLYYGRKHLRKEFAKIKR